MGEVVLAHQRYPHACAPRLGAQRQERGHYGGRSDARKTACWRQN